MMHRIPEPLLQHQVKVALVGAGGTGSQMLTGLARLDSAMRAMEHPGGLSVTVYDPDVVTRSNVGRQLFSPADIGQAKATVLVHRINCWYGLDWHAVTARFAFPALYGMTDAGTVYQTVEIPQIVISCVDTASSRREIYKIVGRINTPVYYWLDCGNRQRDGQVVLGEFNAWVSGTPYARAKKDHQKRPPKPVRLPHVVDLYTDLLDESIAEDAAPSCSVAESLERQDLFINDHISRWALHLLWTLFRTGEIAHHGYVINLADGIVNPIPVPSK